MNDKNIELNYMSTIDFVRFPILFRLKVHNYY